ncbi:hypothetical protein L202_00085 [Cryptococcus amylolentus CBS 6039]|uniref:Exonuclease domain-containing protein n=1 Tax=Cryptococcus amylolentus CBS 6039 TaxID=1295533 RepID=A0A1E3I5T3_9TREE|nr:hypothetical protein L202_00085 [Cryptococcus amylolentus CBS 6039]ODN84063.1 hypothetical protein L202_00085 [Cryptococcus amylolentus CBS 6039]
MRRLPKAKLEKEDILTFALQPSGLVWKWGYPDSKDKSLSGNTAGSTPSGEGERQRCYRCKSFYTVSSDLAGKERECRHHYATPKPVPGRGKIWRHECCGRQHYSEGCSYNYHVFRHNNDDKALAKREGYKSVKEYAEDGEKDKDWVDVVALDCEMIYTLAGLSLARVTIIDTAEKVLLDEFVKPTQKVIDYNTKFSGITKTNLDGATLDVEGARAAVCKFIGPETIIIGHGLENDLRALRLFHDRLVDTSALFPHPRGLLRRRGLREVVKEKLGYSIQDLQDKLGHYSVVDATAAVDLVRWKMLKRR